MFLLALTLRMENVSSENPRLWRFTWEAQSHTPILKLFLFNSFTKPSIHCNNLDIELHVSQSLLLVKWLQDDTRNVSLRVPIPKVLVDPDSPLSFSAFDDHIQVKLVLLLPVDHPVFSDLCLSGDGAANEGLDSVKPLVMDSDIKSLSSMGGVHFYCRSCSTRLTTSPLREFVEMPSVNWQEIADNWFGGCCCSFGGASEKLVDRYADAYTCTKGICLLNSTSVTLSIDDLSGCKFCDRDGIPRQEIGKNLSDLNNLREKRVTEFGSLSCKDTIVDSDGERIKCKSGKEISEADSLLGVSESEVPEDIASRLGCCHLANPALDCTEENIHEVPQLPSTKQRTGKDTETLVNRRSLLNGFLGDVFMAKSYNHSVNIEWKLFDCPHCCSPLGAYPCVDGKRPIDDGVRLFKCYISTALPVGTTNDLFRHYHLEKMFANLLMESAKDELSFRTVVKDLTTKSPMLKFVLVNPDSWCCSGCCYDSKESVPKMQLQPVIKLLFSDCSSKISQIRVFEDWLKNNMADEVFMLPFLVQNLTKTITSKKDLLPPSCTLFDGLSSTFLLR